MKKISKGKKGKPKPKDPKVLDPKKDFDNPVRKPRQARLPSMDDPKIEVLHGIAEEYADLRDRRMEIGRQEVEMKNKILDLMKAHKRTHYHYGGMDVSIIVEKEKVRVKIAKGDEETDEPETPAAEEPAEG